ncbi:MAG: FecR domain-containing protein [Cyclobacteriaceae bacterium]
MATNYQSYTLLDFITDEHFKSWVLNPDAEQNQFWHDWLAEHPDKVLVVSQAKEFILSVHFHPPKQTSHPSQELRSVKASVYEKVIRDAQTNPSRPEPVKLFSTRFSTLKIAASVLLLCTLAFLVYQYQHQEAEVPEPHQLAYSAKTTQRGEKLSFALPDGSVVKLNAESELRFASSFESQRTVYLKGEAYFEVERDTLKPFKVVTDQLTTEVLGTSFNVKFSPQDSSVQVAVTSGKVGVSAGRHQEQHYLVPTELLRYEQGVFSKSHFDEELLIGWKDGIIAFENADLDEITQRLSNWYDVDFEIKGQTRVIRKFTGKFKNRNLRHVLEGIGYSSNFTSTIQKNKVIIYVQ